MSTYVIAVKYDMRDRLTLPDAIKQIRGIEHLRVLEGNYSSTARIEASQSAIEQVKSLIAWGCHIESIIPHTPQW